MDLPPLLPRISDYLDWHAARTPEAEALVLGGERIRYRQLKKKVDALARALMAAGVAKGDRVCVLQTPHPEYFVTFLAAASIGAIWVGLNPRYQLQELSHVISDADPHLLIARSRIAGRDYSDDLAALQGLACNVERTVIFAGDPVVAGAEPMEGFVDRGRQVSDEDLTARRMNCGGRDPCMLVYTSGSTGKPKGAVLHHEGVCRFSLEQNRLWPLSPYRSLNYFPINHVGCVLDCSTPALVAGGTMVMMEQFDPVRSMELIQSERISIWGSVPSVFQMQLALPDFDKYDLSAVQLIVWEGAAMPADLIEPLRRITPRLATNYGMTETTSAITIVEPTDDLDVLANSVGVAFPGVEIRLAGPDGGEVGKGATGEVQARSAGNLIGYWKQDTATRDAFTDDGFFRTGDLAERRQDGRYRIVGRIKEMYKSGGYNVYPREIETALEAHPAVALAAVVSVPDPVWQEVGVAYVTLKSEATTEQILAHCRAHLANYKVPKLVVFESELPLLPIGKIDKVTLSRRARDIDSA